MNNCKPRRLKSFSSLFHSRLFSSLLLVVYLNRQNIFCLEPSPENLGRGSNSKPKIWLKSFILDDSYDILPFPEVAQASEIFQTDSILKNGTVYTVLSDVSYIHFMCEANYPIRWNVPYPDQMMFVREYMFNTLAERRSQLGNDTEQPINSEFRVLLQLRFSQSTFLGGNFTCESINDEPGMKSGIYIFGEGEEPLQANGLKLSVNVSETNSTVLVLPCRPALPSFKLSLLKKKSYNVTNEEWILVELNESISFNPMYGYRIDLKDKLISDVIGNYKCQLESDPDIFVLFDVNIGELPESTVHSLNLRQKFKTPDAFVSVRKGYLECCSGANKSSGVYTCKSGNHCDLAKTILANDFSAGRETLMSFGGKGCYVSDIFGRTGMGICQSSDMDVVAQFTRVYDLDRKLNGTEHDDDLLFWTEDNMPLHDLSKSEPKLAEKITLRFATSVPKPTFRGNIDKNVAYILLPLDDGRLELSEPVAESNHSSAYLKPHIGDIFEGQGIFVLCYTLRFYYANGGWIRLNWRNGTKTVIKGNWNDYQNEVTYAMIVTIVEEDNVLIGNIETDLEMESLDCFAPQWNTTKWDKRNVKLDIKAAISPKLFNSEDEIVNLRKVSHKRFGTKGISCSVIEGKPSPTITWEKDGKVIDWESSFNHSKVITYGNQSSVTVHFLKATDEINGTYRCIARNKGGEAVKIFEIFVSKKGVKKKVSGMSIVMIGLLSAFFILMLILVAAAKRIRECSVKNDISVVG